jgi:hypothetical protein
MSSGIMWVHNFGILHKKQGLDFHADLKKVPDNNQYLFSAIARWQDVSSDILLQWTSITSALSFPINCCIGLHTLVKQSDHSQSFSNSRTCCAQRCWTVASGLRSTARCQRRQRRRQPRRLRRAGLLPLVPACQLPASSAVATLPWRDCSRGSK